MSKKTKISKIKNNNALAETKNTLSEIENWKERFSAPTLDENDRLSEFNEFSKLKNLSKEQAEKKEVLGKELILTFGLNNGVFLQSIVNNLSYAKGLAKIRQDLIKEYKCQGTSELMLVDRIVSAYWRGIRYESYLNRLFEEEPDKFSFNDLKLRVAKELYKGIELASRQFESGLTFLRNLKQPRLNIRVNADNAYLAQNQQIINKEESLKPNDLGDFYEVVN
jgi:hypothetical protein